ncbi:MAG: winged helix-turn-helix domain-containing protein [Acidobacteriia bacterium]|nr:winged helix-turn-helix domain-containing protein [Terriglobia bacterium]
MSSGPVRILETVRFGEDIEFDLRANELRRCGRVLKLERIPTELLLLLVEQRDSIVTREQIVKRIWGPGVFLDTDNSINIAVRKIRQVLKDSPERPRFIQTVTGKGYRFVAPAVEAPAEPQIPAAEPDTVVVVTRADASARWPWAIPIGVLVALIVALSGWQIWSHYRANPKPAGGRLMLAVLPFENLTGDAGQEYFSDGLTEEMITQLGRLDPQRLAVIARTSVMTYKHSPQQLDRIARDLNVQYLLEGSVRRDSGKVRITAQLIRASDQTHLWAHEYDRELKDLLLLQGEIAQEVAEGIQLTLADNRKPAAAASPSALSPASYEAYDLYLKGRYFWNKRTPQGFQQAAECFQQAIAKDPKYSRAYAGLADTYALMSSYYLAPPNEVMPKARTAALKALQIDDGLAEAHTSLALIAEMYDWDWQTAEKEYRRAIQLNPNYATAHHWYAEFLAFQGRFDEALAESERARHLDPLSVIIAADRGAILYFSRQYDKAIEQFRAVLDMEPNFSRAHLIVDAYVEKGRFAAALAHIETWRRIEDAPWVPWVWASEVYVYRRSGQPMKAQQALAKLEHWNRHSHLDAVPILAAAYVGMNNQDEALAWLQKAYEEHSGTLTCLKVDPIYDPLRGDPRFQELLRRVGLEQ